MQIPLSNRRAQLVAGRVRAIDRALVLEAPAPVLKITYATTTLSLTVRTTLAVALTLTTSDGSTDVFRNSLVKQFPDARQRTSSLTTDRRNIDLINVDNSGLTSLNGPLGTADLRSFPNLVAGSVIGSMCNVFKISVSYYSLVIDGAQCAGKPLDISEVSARELRGSGTYCNNVLWPTDAPLLMGIFIDYHALTQPQILPALPALTQLYMSYNQAASKNDLGLLDLRQNPQLQVLNARQARVNELRVAVGCQLQYINLIFNDFSTGSPASLVEVFTRCLQLNRIDAYNTGLDASTQEAIFDIVLAAGWARTLLFSGGSVNTHYFSGASAAGRACEPLVTAEAQAKLAQLRALGCYIEVNDPIFQATLLDDTSARIDLINSTRAITWWGVGDKLNCLQAFNSDLFNYGEHVVLSGSGTSWIISNKVNFNGYAGSTGLCLLTKA